MHFAILQCNTIVHSSKQVFYRLSVYSWEGRRALSYTKSYILINFMVHLHYYQSHIQISSRDNIVHGRMFHYMICISIDLRGTKCTSICQSLARVGFGTLPQTMRPTKENFRGMALVINWKPSMVILSCIY